MRGRSNLTSESTHHNGGSWGGDCLPDFVESRRMSIIASITLILTVFIFWILPSETHGNVVAQNQPIQHKHSSKQSGTHPVHGLADPHQDMVHVHDHHVQHSQHDHHHHSISNKPSDDHSFNSTDLYFIGEPFSSANPTHSHDPIQNLLYRYQREIFLSTWRHFIHLPNGSSTSSTLYQTSIETTEGGESHTLVLTASTPCLNNKTPSLLELAEIATRPIIEGINKLYPHEFLSTDHSLNVRWPLPSEAVQARSQYADASRNNNAMIPSMPSDPHLHTSSASPSMLIVFTTCDQLAMTILSLQYLTLHIESSSSRTQTTIADLLIVDDHSVDGTVEYLRKRGFAVITKDEATGLTDSWNIGYRMAIALGYDHVLFTNNDVLITRGSLELMNQALQTHAMVLPITTDKGAGHNPLQSIMKVHNLSPAWVPYTMDYRNAEAIQESLHNLNSCYPQPSKVRDRPHFNGFSFAVNLHKIRHAAFEENVNLFDPNDRIVGQEDHLAQRMSKVNLVPMILPCVFFYHFKSVTVSSANITAFQETLQRQGLHNITVKQTHISQLTLTYRDPNTGKEFKKTVDIREDLHFYHLMQDSTKKRKHSESDSDDDDDESTGEPTDNEANDKGDEETKSFISQLIEDLMNGNTGESHTNTTDMRPTQTIAALHCLWSTSSHGATPLLPWFPQHVDSKLTRLQHLYHDNYLKKMNWNIKFTAQSPSRVCLYPYHWPAHCNRILDPSNAVTSVNNIGLSKFTPELFAVDDETTLLANTLSHTILGANNPAKLIQQHDDERHYVLGFVIPWLQSGKPLSLLQLLPTANYIDFSDVATESKERKSDLMRSSILKTTAHDLAEELLSHYSNIRVKFLHQGLAWYSIDHLLDVDILLVFSEDYDLLRAMPWFQDSLASSSTMNNASKTFAEHHPHQLKSTLITIAWIYDHVDQWLIKPWFGHFDHILTSSDLANKFLHKLSSTIGFPLSCSIACPHVKKSNIGLYSPLFESRSAVPVHFHPLPCASKQSLTSISMGNHHVLEAQKLFHGLDFIIFISDYHDTFSAIKVSSALLPMLQHGNSKLHSGLEGKKGKIVIGYPQTEGLSHSFQHHHHHTSSSPSPHRNLRINLNTTWEIEVLSYEVIREACKHVKVLIEIQSHQVFQDFGGLSKLAVDSITGGHQLSSGQDCLFVSDNLMAFETLQQSHSSNDSLSSSSAKAKPQTSPNSQIPGLTVKPAFSTINELIHVLDYFLSQEDQRKKAINMMRDALQVINSTSVTFVEILKKAFGVKVAQRIGKETVSNSMHHDRHNSEKKQIQHQHLDPRRKLKTSDQEKTSTFDTNMTLCVGIRTLPAHQELLLPLIRSLTNQYRNLTSRDTTIGFKVVLADIASDLNFASKLIELAEQVHVEQISRSSMERLLSVEVMFDQQLIQQNNEKDKKVADTMLENMMQTQRKYTISDRLLQVLLSSNKECSTSEEFSITSAASCDWILITDGNSQYKSDWLETVMKYMHDRENLDTIAWDFDSSTSKTMSFSSDDVMHFNLGSIMFRSTLLAKAKAKFLSNSVFSVLTSNRDLDFTRETLKDIKGIKVIRESLAHYSKR